MCRGGRGNDFGSWSGGSGRLEYLQKIFTREYGGSRGVESEVEKGFDAILDGRAETSLGERKLSRQRGFEDDYRVSEVGCKSIV